MARGRASLLGQDQQGRGAGTGECVGGGGDGDDGCDGCDDGCVAGGTGDGKELRFGPGGGGGDESDQDGQLLCTQRGRLGLTLELGSVPVVVAVAVAVSSSSVVPGFEETRASFSVLQVC